MAKEVLQFFPVTMTHGDILQRLARLDPAKVKALEALAIIALKEAWPKITHQRDEEIARRDTG